MTTGTAIVHVDTGICFASIGGDAIAIRKSRVARSNATDSGSATGVTVRRNADMATGTAIVWVSGGIAQGCCADTGAAIATAAIGVAAADLADAAGRSTTAPAVYVGLVAIPETVAAGETGREDNPASTVATLEAASRPANGTGVAGIANDCAVAHLERVSQFG